MSYYQGRAVVPGCVGTKICGTVSVPKSRGIRLLLFKYSFATLKVFNSYTEFKRQLNAPFFLFLNNLTYICRDSRDTTPDLFRRFLCPVGSGQKSARRAGPGQIFGGLSRMVVARDKRDREKFSRDRPIPSLAHPWLLLCMIFFDAILTRRVNTDFIF